MRQINKIIVHCTASREGQSLTVADIDKMHRARGWNGIGYHYLIYADGSIHKGRPVENAGAHVSGHNADSIGICYVGGLDGSGNPKDTRTEAQKAAIRELVNELCQKYPTVVEVKGHRDYSPDLNGNGKIESFEWLKACPCFDVQSEFTSFLPNVNVKP